MSAACGQPVVVGASQTELAQVIALPDGRLRFESAVVPQRARQADGSFAELDLGLREDADGLVRPGVSVADIAFSGGGDGPVVTLRRTGKTVTFTWPYPLPAPTIAGDSATYAEALPGVSGVDLVMRATPVGFTHVVVVKTAQAAASEAVRQLRLGLGGDAQVRTMPDGSLRALSGSTVIAAAEKAVMWDSSAGSGGDVMSASQEDSVSSATAPGDAARTAVVKTELAADGSELVLTPDAAVLDAAATGGSLPVFIDPAWSVFKAKWAYATSDGSSNTDYTYARVGKNSDTGATYRSFFEFPTTSGGVSLKGKHIESAHVQMDLYHSWSCGNTVASMYLTSVINATMKATWSKMTLSKFLDDASGHANKAGGCADSPQPNMLMKFQGSTVTSQVQTAATNSWNSITVGFTARASDGSGESTQDRWKKFEPGDAKLVVDYDSIPGKPNSLQVAGVACPTSEVLTIGTLNPTLSAVLPDADTSQTLKGAFVWVEVPASGNPDDAAVTNRVQPDPTTAANTRATTVPITIVTGKTYAFHVTAMDPAPYERWSGWGVWCQFKADTTVPPVPTIAPGTVDGPGKSMTFTFSTTTTDVTKFRYGWSSPPMTEVAATGTSTKTATVTITVPAFGKNTLWVRSIDATPNLGNIGSVEITAARPAPPIARWGLETHPLVTQADALADQQPTLSGDTPLSASGVSWTDDARMIDAQTLTMPSTTSATTAQTSGSVVDTTKSFSVAAWVRRTSTSSAYKAIVSQEGSTNSGFILDNSQDGGWWSFRMYDTDTASYSQVQVKAPAELNVWTHLTGVYDATEQKLRIYKNGVLVEEKSRTVPVWSATGDFHIGWAKFGGGGFMTNGVGQVADVQVFDRVLVADDFTGQLASDPDSGGFNEPGIVAPAIDAPVGAWDFEFAVGCYLADYQDTCEAPDTLTGWNRWLALSVGAEIVQGHPGAGSASGLWLDGELDDDADPSTPPLATSEYGRSATKNGVVNELTQWVDTPVLRTDQSFTISAWVVMERTDLYQAIVAQDDATNSGFVLYFSPENGGAWKFQMRGSPSVMDDANTSWAHAPAPDATTLWHHIVVTVDVSARQIRMFVDGEQAYVGAMHSAYQPWQANGPLELGHRRASGTVDRWFHGGIDDVRVYQGVLSGASVAELYAAQSAP